MSVDQTEWPDRLTREQDFHNRRFGGEAADPRAGVRKWYRALRATHDGQAALLRARGTGRAVMEIGCADGTLSLDELDVPGFAASLDGVDIAEDAVAVARCKAAARGLGRASFHQMDAKALRFPDDSFDVVFGRGILHHLDVDRALAEIARVLRPGGAALFVEPLGHNPVINWYRSRTPTMRTPDERPLRRHDLARARRHFRATRGIMAGLTTPLAVPLLGGPAGRPLLGALESLDRVLLALPGLRWQAWHVCLVLEK